MSMDDDERPNTERFSAYGYGAHVCIEKYDDRNGSMYSQSTSAAGANGEGRVHNTLKLCKRPVVRQCFHQGLLWSSARRGEVGSFELFADLLYVGIIDLLGNRAGEIATGEALLVYSITFCMAFKIWSDLTLISNWFERNDIVQKLSTCIYLVVLFGYTTNIGYAFEGFSATSSTNTYVPMLSFYLIERFYSVLYFAWLAWVVPLVTGACLFQSFTTVVGAVFWIGSVHLDYPVRYIFIWIAIFIDLFAGTFGLWISKASRDKGSWVAPLARRWFDIYPACDIEHRTERTKAFVSLVFGYSVLTLLYQSSAKVGVNAHLGKGILGLLQAFAFQWLYFEIDNHDVHTHAIRRHWASSTTWAVVHLLFVLAYTLAAATQCKIVLAHDCPDSRLQDLGEVWQVDSMSELSRGLRWFYCGGVGIALFSMGLLSFCHIHKEITDARLKKTPRLAIRTCISVIIICLPIAEKLNSLQLTSINTALVVLSLIIDLYGTSYTGDRFWTGGWDDDSKKDIEYTATLPLEPKASLRLDEDLHTRKRVIAEDRSSTEAV